MTWLGRIGEMFTSPDERKRSALLRAPRVSIADATVGNVVQVGGRAAAATEGAFPAPFSGRNVLWWYARYEVLRGSEAWVSGRHSDAQRSGDWGTRITASAGRALLIDDDSGMLATIDAANARVIVPEEVVEDLRFIKSRPPVFEEFLRTRGFGADVGTTEGRRFYEAVIQPGDRVIVEGRGKHVPGPPREDRYRSTSSTILVLESPVVTAVRW